ncbi:hypothetical protein T069G_04207 [Trichoderma breve]|uniref:Uncharacterized protein n=1 Tax=Trichoderma breve TaxID=2034170 RepID=A0A9W9EAT1_9HYPO|nr:hypothetical protein T069G_04207 [Trichoderma breve]KAJ4863253.1 hypothetical protein T069G_04207 [Trichoderma breve]
MGSDSKAVSWQDNSYKKEQKKGSSANQQGRMTPSSPEIEQNSNESTEATDPSTVNLKANVFTKVANTFTLLFNKDTSRYDRRPETPAGWTTTGELGCLRAEQDAQYELMEELELKIEDLKKEVDQQKLLIKAYETRVSQNEELLQHCMHWISMAQIFGDVPVSKERMNWKAGRDAALVGPAGEDDEDGDDDDSGGDENGEIVEDININNGRDGEDINGAKEIKDIKDTQVGKAAKDGNVFKCIHALNADKGI